MLLGLLLLLCVLLLLLFTGLSPSSGHCPSDILLQNVNGDQSRHMWLCYSEILTYSGIMDCHHFVDYLTARLEDGGEVQHGEYADRVPGRECLHISIQNQHMDNKIIKTT